MKSTERRRLNQRGISLIETLETTRAQRFNDMVSGSKTKTVGGVMFTIQTTVNDDTPTNGLKSIAVNVSWKDPLGQKNVTVNTIYTEVRRF